MCGKQVLGPMFPTHLSFALAELLWGLGFFWVFPAVQRFFIFDVIAFIA